MKFDVLKLKSHPLSEEYKASHRYYVKTKVMRNGKEHEALYRVIPVSVMYALSSLKDRQRMFALVYDQAHDQFFEWRDEIDTQVMMDNLLRTGKNWMEDNIELKDYEFIDMQLFLEKLVNEHFAEKVKEENDQDPYFLRKAELGFMDK